MKKTAKKKASVKKSVALSVKEKGVMLPAGSLSREQIELVKRTVAKEATDDELKLFLYTAARTGLDPLVKQIYFVKRKNNKTGIAEGTIQVGIDGMRATAEKTGVYAGNDDPVFDDEKTPKKAMVTVYKIVGGIRCPFTASARWDQYFPGEYLGFMWKKMPHVMLGKCAEALALRKAFPLVLGGIYTNEEMQQANKTATPVNVIKEEAKIVENKKTMTSAELLEKAQAQISSLNDVEELIALDGRVQGNADIPKALKAKVHELINARVDALMK